MYCLVINSNTVLHRCSYVKFPNHPQSQHCKPCSAMLMKKVKSSAGTTSLYPRQLFCYKSIIDSLKNLMARATFLQSCELWRNRQKFDNTLTDVYDGKVWHDFLYPGGIPFLSLPYNFAFAMNIDWFQLLKHTTYSVGAIYLSILNLPLNLRYNGDNVILVGIIPGPHEPKSMTGYLQLLVDDLNVLWKGVFIPSASGTLVIVRSALICTACDIPASRKVSGFVGHNAYHACSKCLKAFPTEKFREKADFTGTDCTLWPPRNFETHHKHALEYMSAHTKEEQKN